MVSCVLAHLDELECGDEELWRRGAEDGGQRRLDDRVGSDRTGGQTLQAGPHLEGNNTAA